MNTPNIDSIIQIHTKKLELLNAEIASEMLVGVEHEKKMKQLVQEFGFTLQALIELSGAEGVASIYEPKQRVVLSFDQLVSTLKAVKENPLLFHLNKNIQKINECNINS